MRCFGFLIPVVCFLLSGCSSSPKVARWESTDGPNAQNISSIAVNEQLKGHLLAGLMTGDVYASNNAGMTWTKLSTLKGNTAIHRFIQHPDDPTRVFAVTAGGVFLSTNTGQQWVHAAINRSAPDAGCRALAIEPYNTKIMYAGLKGMGIHKSTDGGTRWLACNGGLDSLAITRGEVYDIAIDPAKPDNLYAAVTGIGVIKSTDGGSSWTTLTAIVGSGGIAPTSVVLHPKSARTICFGMEAGSIYKSVDGGQTWSPTRFGSGGNTPPRLVRDPGNADALYAGTENDVSLSTDFGTTWRTISNGLPRVATAIAIAPGEPHPTVYAYGEGIGLTRSTNAGSSWVSVGTLLGGSTVGAIAGNKRSDALYAAVGASVHKWNPQTRTWSSASNNLTGGAVSSIAVDTDSSSIVFAATTTGIFGTRDGGASWNAGSPQVRGKTVNVIAAHSILTTRLLAESHRELLVSTNRGATWNSTKPLDGRYHVHTFAFSNSDAGLVLGATEEGGVILSTDGGLSWEKSRYGLEGNDVVAVTFDKNEKQTLYAWTSRGAGFRSTNKGLVWNRYSPPWQPVDEIHLAVDRYDPSSVVALIGNDRLYYSASGGATWFSIPIEPVRGSVVSAYWTSQSSNLYIGLKDTGMHRISLGEYLKKLFEE